MAERVAQEDGIPHNLPSDQVEGSAGSGDPVGGTVESVAPTADPVGKLKEEVWRGKQRNRADIERRYPKVFGTRTNTDDAGGTDADRDLTTIHEWAFGFGWDGLIETLAAIINTEIERDPRVATGYTTDEGWEMPPFRITQMKEKFGGLRFYYEGGNNRIHGYAQMTEDLSQAMCEVCGMIGNQCRMKSGAWVSTLCPECADHLGYKSVSDEGDEQA